MVKVKYKQLCLSPQIGSVTTMNIHNRWQKAQKDNDTAYGNG